MTLTSIGYGDITAQNPPEYAVCTVMMISSGLIWAYVIGSVCSVIYSLDPNTRRFQQMMDELNLMMEDRSLPQPMRRRLRNFINESRQVARSNQQQHLVEGLSPQLQAEVALATTKEWTSRVWYLVDLETEALVETVRRMSRIIYTPDEEVYCGRALFIIQRGIAARNGRVMGKGQTFGE